MSETCKTVKVQPWSKSQGDFVEIDETEYLANKARYKLYEGKTPVAPPAPLTKTEKGGKAKTAAAAVPETPVEQKIDYASDEAAELATNSGLTNEQIAAIKGTGKEGAITVEDVEKFIDALTAA